MKKGKYKGVSFSLVELLVVIAILTIFSTFAIVSYGSYRQTLWLKNSAREIESVLNSARTMAINQNAHFEVVYGFANNQYWIDLVDSNQNILKPKIVTPITMNENVQMKEIRIGTSTIYSSGLARVHFYPTGRCDYARFYLIKKGDDESSAINYWTVLTYPSTGYPHTFPNQIK